MKILFLKPKIEIKNFKFINIFYFINFKNF